MKKGIFLLMAALLAGILWRPGFSQEDMQVVDSDGFSQKQRPPVVFRHEEHNETAQIEECNECHHVYEDGKKLEDESSEDESCADCHFEKDDGNMPGLRKAFHTNCKGCHLQRNQGPVMCGSCHVRN